MHRNRLPITLMIAGLFLAVFGTVLSPAGETAASRTQSRTGTLEPTTGLAPIENIIDLWQTRAEASPSDYLSRTQLGFALLTQARETADLEIYETAEAVFGDALERNPKYPASRLGLAQSLHAQHQFANALVVVSALQADQPGLRAATLLAADANWELGNYDEAETLYEQLLRHERSGPTLSRAMKVALRNGDNALAIALAEEAMQVADASPQRANAVAFYRFQLAHAANEAGDVVGAIALLNEARSIDPGHAGATEMLGAIRYEQGDLAGAAELYETLLSNGPAADLHGTYAELQRALGNEDLADEHERLGLELAEATIDRFPAERRHLAQFFMSRDPHRALELAELDLLERQDDQAYELLAEAQAAVAGLES